MVQNAISCEVKIEFRGRPRKTLIEYLMDISILREVKYNYFVPSLQLKLKLKQMCVNVQN